LAAGFGEQFADALAASALSGVEARAPIVVIPHGTLSEEAKGALSDPKVGKVIIVGGEAVIPKSVEEEIESLGRSFEVRRLEGDNRQQPAEKLFKIYTRATWSDTAILVSGESFADALSIAPWAAFSKSPLFFTSPGGSAIESSTEELLKSSQFKHLVVVGGEAAVTKEALVQARDALGIPDEATTRLGGEDRYETSVLVARWSTAPERSSSLRLSWAGVGIATGSSHPDALSGAALLSLTGSPVLLISPSHATFIEAELTSHKDDLFELYFFGGEAAISVELVTACIQASGYTERGLTLVWRPDESVKVG
jgi:cell wall-associated protease